MRSQGTRESLDFLEVVRDSKVSQVNASTVFFYLIFENDDCLRARVLQNDEDA